MECNKEEALRAKGIAENRMQGKDFGGARKIALKAQQLFPDLENISQMLAVCEVHCSADIKVNGEIDWYAILQVGAAADEIAIKKQYRKLALLLHPDKNQFAGAEAAFKLVGEAHRTLSDPARRTTHDMKRGASFKPGTLRQPAYPPNKSAATGKSTRGSTNAQHPSQPPDSTFWTMCPSCGIKYKYFRSILSKLLRCQNCLKAFIAYDLKIQGVPPVARQGSSRDRPGIPEQDIRGPGSHVAGQKSGNASSGMGFQGNVSGRPTSVQPGSRSGLNAKATEDRKLDDEVQNGDGIKFETVKLPKVNTRKQVKPSGESSGQKRGRKVVSESSDTVIGDDGSKPPRSTRKKQNTSHDEASKQNANDCATPSAKRSRKDLKDSGTDNQASGGGKASKKRRVEESLPNGLQQGDKEGKTNNAASSKSDPCDSNVKTSGDMESVIYPDPEFFDFEKERHRSKFAVDQIWAVYDDMDAMPRFYVQIKDIYDPNFHVRFVWLENDPVGKTETEWSKQDLPVSCGNFRRGKIQITTEIRMFSHVMSWSKGNKRSSYNIYPRKGEIWALFKDWDNGWSKDADNHRVYEYELVEVLSDYTESSGISVANLVKINGFVSLFMRAVDEGPVDIPATEMLRFSHMVPSYRMTGEERVGVPTGSFELDATSLPTNLTESFRCVSIDGSKVGADNLENVSAGLHFNPSVEEKLPTGPTNANNPNEEYTEKHKSRDPCPNLQNGACKKDPIQASGEQHSTSEAVTFAEKAAVDSRDRSAEADVEMASAPPVETPNHVYEYPESEFSNFDEARTSDKFECGQIWALYSDVSSFPNYYGLITKADPGEFNVELAWLEGYTKRKEEKHWFEEMPVSCGTFKMIDEKSVFDTTESFSHRVNAEPAGKKDQYIIYPNIGEIWALYKDWSLQWSRSNLESCKYDAVEILSRDDYGVKVLLLKKVRGYRSIFMPGKEGSGFSMFDIPVAQYMKFSHQIPAARLTKEKGGALRGYWELDPASVPEILLAMDSD